MPPPMPNRPETNPDPTPTSANTPIRSTIPSILRP